MADEVFTRRFDRLARRGTALLVGGLLFSGAFAVWALWPPLQAEGYEPEQPIPFSHKVMAGDAKIPCLYCHKTAESGPVAGIPTVAECMNCHRHLKPKDNKGRLKPAFAEFMRYVDPVTGEALQPIPWVKVHDLSDFAYFDHSRHTVGARLQCSECHGPVERMERVRLVSSLKMGWCLDCHRKPPEEWRTDGRATRGPTHCAACHR